MRKLTFVMRFPREVGFYYIPAIFVTVKDLYSIFTALSGLTVHDLICIFTFFTGVMAWGVYYVFISPLGVMV